MKIKSQKVQRFFLITALFVSVFLSMIIYFHDYIKQTLTARSYFVPPDLWKYSESYR